MYRAYGIRQPWNNLADLQILAAQTLSLGLSEQTVITHRALFMARLGAATSADVIRIAVEDEF